MSALAIILRVDALIARACCPGASEEEQRTCAVIAVRLVREHDLLRRDEDDGVDDDDEPTWRIIRSRFRGACRRCGADIYAGDACAWARSNGAICLACHRDAQRRAAS